MKAGLSSFYGPAILSEFAENEELDSYTKKWVKKVLFSSEKIGKIEAANEWINEYLPWDITNNKI